VSSEGRLLDAVTEVCAREGYAPATVQRIHELAGVSRATFYQYFSSAEDCFLSAYRTHAGQLLEAVAAAARSCPRELGVLDALVQLSVEQPNVTLLLWREGLAAGTGGQRERELLVTSVERAVAAPVSEEVIDLPLTMLVGGVSRFLAMRLTEGPVTEEVADDLRAWARALTSPRQSGYSDRLLPAPVSQTDEQRPVLDVVRSLPAHERLLEGTAAVILAKGYGAVTVKDIAAAAGVSRRLFYQHFQSKRDAFIAAYEHAFEQAVAVCAPAYFSPGPWPERVWNSAMALTRFFANQQAFAHIGFIECYALGPDFIQRINETQLAFTLFLEEGYRQNRQAQDLPRSCSALTAMTLFEAGYQACRFGASPNMRRYLSPIVYMTLAPFLGPEQAAQFVTHKLNKTPITYTSTQKDNN
jgi:AcrR family transcriptional regulator